MLIFVHLLSLLPSQCSPVCHHYIHHKNTLLAHMQLSVPCDSHILSAVCLLRQPALVPGTTQPHLHNSALLVKLHKVSVDPVFQFPKILSNEAPLFGLRTTPSSLVLSENLLQVHPVSASTSR